MNTDHKPPYRTPVVEVRECRSCGSVLAESDALTCSQPCAEKWRAWVLAQPAGCERSGDCVLPFRHGGSCDWGDDEPSGNAPSELQS